MKGFISGFRERCDYAVDGWQAGGRAIRLQTRSFLYRHVPLDA